MTEPGTVDRPLPHPVLLPDDDGELLGALAVLGEVVAALQSDEVPPLEGLGPVELDAVGALVAAVDAGDRAGRPDLYAPDGRWNYGLVSVLMVDSFDLARAGAAVAALGRSLLPGGDGDVVETLGHWARDREASSDLVARFAKAHGVLDLAPDQDTLVLAELLGSRSGPVVLTAGQAAAYERVVDRALAMGGNDPLERFVHRGLT